MEFNWIPLIVGVMTLSFILLLIGFGEFWYWVSNGEPWGFAAFVLSIILLITIPLGFILA